MAETIALHKSKFDGLGSVLDKFCSCLGGYNATLNELKRSAGAVDGSTCNLEEVINDISNSEESKEEKVKRAKELKSKLDTFVKNAVKHESDAADEIKKKKEDFYKDHEFLRPDCEKVFGKLRRFVSEAAAAIGQWVMDNLDKIIAAIIVIAAIVIVIVCPAAACAVIAIIVSVMSALMGIADIICMIAFGKDVAGCFEALGWNTASKVWKGVALGLDIASVILPIGALPSAGANAYKTTFKELFRHPVKSLKGLGNNMAVKNFGSMLRHPITALKDFGKSGINSLKEAFKDGALKGFKNLGEGGLKMMTGYDDLVKGEALFKAWKNGQPVGETAIKLLGLDNIARLAGSSNQERYTNMLNSNSDNLADAVGHNNIATDALTEMKVEVTPGGSNSTDAFYNSLKGDENLSSQLMSNTGVNVNDFSNGSELKTALENNGFTLNTGALDANGNANVSVVQKWAYDVTGAGSGNALDLRTLSQTNSDFRQNAMDSYNTFMNTKNALFRNAFANDCAENMYKKGMEHVINDGLIGKDGLFGNVVPGTHNRVDSIMQDVVFKSVQAPWLN